MAEEVRTLTLPWSLRCLHIHSHPNPSTLPRARVWVAVRCLQIHSHPNPSPNPSPSPNPTITPTRYAPKAAPGYIDIIASVRLAPGDPVVLTKTLPKGITCVPMHFSTKDGVWEGLPFVVP